MDFIFLKTFKDPWGPCGSCKFVQLAIFFDYTCEHGYDLCFNLILLKIDIHVRFMMMHV